MKKFLFTCTGDATRLRDPDLDLLVPTASRPPRNAVFLQDPPIRAATAPLRRLMLPQGDITLPFAIACAAAMAPSIEEESSRREMERAALEREGKE